MQYPVLLYSNQQDNMAASQDRLLEWFLAFRGRLQSPTRKDLHAMRWKTQTAG